MKTSSKKSPSKDVVIVSKKQQTISFQEKKKTIKTSSPTKKQITHSKSDASKAFVGVGHSAKRYSKRVVKNMLLSRTFHTVFKIGAGVLLFSLVSYAGYNHVKVAFVNDVVVSKSEIIDRVAKLTSLPELPPEAVVRVEDPERLKKQNNFYENVKNGDYIVMYPKLAIIYDLRNNNIVAIKKLDGN